MVQYLLLYFTVLRYLKIGRYRKIILQYDYKAGILLSTNLKQVSSLSLLKYYYNIAPTYVYMYLCN